MSTPSVTVSQLQCFVAVVDLGSFAEAGRRLGFTTSAVSKTLSRLEAAKGIRLLNRSTHAVSLTPEGERLLGPARAALESVELVDFAMGEASAARAGGRVRLSAPTAFLAACLTPLLSRFHEEYPGIHLDLRGSDAMINLADEATDLALRTGTLDGIPGHLRQHLFRFDWVTCASPEYLDRRGTPLQPHDLADHELIAFRNQRTGLIDPWRYRKGAETIRWPPVVRVTLDDANAVHAAAVAGAGIIWSPRWLVGDSLRTGRLAFVLDDWADVEMDMSIVRRAHDHAPERVNKVVAFLKAHRARFGGSTIAPGRAVRSRNSDS